MLSTSEIILEYVSPLLGAIFANLMFAGETKTNSIVVISLFVLPLSHFIFIAFVLSSSIE